MPTPIHDPTTWPASKRWPATITIVFMTASIAFCASIHAPVIDNVAHTFGCSRTVATLGLTTYLLGFAVGGLVFAPLSEAWGRNAVYRSTLALFVIFNAGCALAPGITSLLAFRFLAGICGSSSISTSGGSISDMWPQSHRSVPLALYTAACFLGPVMAPIVGGFISEYCSWRWGYWLVTLLSGTSYIIMLIFLPETYLPYLQRKATNLESPTTSFNASVLARPILMLFTEPILFLLSLYMAFVNAILYLNFTAYPIIFFQTRNWSPGLAGLAFLGIGLGMAIATACSPLLNHLHTTYTCTHGPKPEARLHPLIPLAPLLPASLALFAITATPPTHFILPLAAGLPFGLAFVPLVAGCIAYLADCYGAYAASAIAAASFLRNVAAAMFPLFAQRFYEGLGVKLAGLVLAGAALLLAPLVWMFWRWGEGIRAKSRVLGHREGEGRSLLGNDDVEVVVEGVVGMDGVKVGGGERGCSGYGAV